MEHEDEDEGRPEDVEFDGFDIEECRSMEALANRNMRSILRRAKDDDDLAVLGRVQSLELFVNAIRDYVERACSPLMSDQLERDTAFANMMIRGVELVTDGKYMEVEPSRGAGSEEQKES